jgi:hypothetical protein
LSGIPTREGGYYGCILLNKLIEANENDAFIYKQNENRWLEVLGNKNKFDLYKEERQKHDGRRNSTVDPLVDKYCQNQTIQGIQDIKWAELVKEFVAKDVCSVDTLNKSCNRLIEQGKLTKPEKGIYRCVAKA